MRAAALAALVACACNSYDPDLGDSPFLCGTDEPRCPEGYRAVDVSPIRCECQRPTGVDAAIYACAGDLYEPNESFRAPTPTTVGTTTFQQRFTNLAICPVSEEDNFALEATQGTLITVRVTFDRTRSAPRVDVLNAQGATLTVDRESPEPGVVVVTHSAMLGGRYHARIRADGVEVNYELLLMITPPS
jgi:hypothetical protein